MKKIIVILMLLVFSLATSQKHKIVKKAFKEYKNENYSKSIEILKTALPILADDEDFEELSFAYYGLGYNYYVLSEYDSSLKYTLIAYDIEEKYDIQKDHSKTMHQLGLLYLERGLNHEAIYYQKKAAALNIKNNDKSRLLKNYNSLGTAFSNIDFLDSSNYYFNLALKNVKNSSIVTEALIYNNIASNKQYENKRVEYDSLMKIAISKIEKANDELWKRLIVSNTFILEESYSQSDKEILDYLKGYYDLSKGVDENLFADANYKLATFYMERDSFEMAVKYLNSANELYVSFGNIQRAKEITDVFISVMNVGAIQELNYTPSDLLWMQNVQYSEALQSEIEMKIESEKVTETLQQDLYYAELSNYLMFSILFTILLTIGFGILRFTSNKRIRTLLINLKNISAIQQSGINNNLSKLTLFLTICGEFRGREDIGLILDEVVEDANKITMSLTQEDIVKQTKRINNASNATTS